jgi:hypothetical protein
MGCRGNIEHINHTSRLGQFVACNARAHANIKHNRSGLKPVHDFKPLPDFRPSLPVNHTWWLRAWARSHQSFIVS